MEYALLSGYGGGYDTNEFAHLEAKVNDLISKGGSTVGGLVLSAKSTPYQAVMQPIGYKYKKASGGLRKTRKNARND